MLDTIKSLCKNLTSYAVVLLLGFIVGVWISYDHLKPELNEAKAQLKSLQDKYETSIDEKEKAKIAAALAQQSKNAEVGMNSNSTATYAYKEKNQKSDPDVDITVPNQQIKISYNNELYNLPLKRTTMTTQKVEGTLCMTQESVVVIDVTDIVNREIANTIMAKDAKIANLEHQAKVAKRQGIQHTVWGSIIGAGVGALVENRRHK